MSKLSKTIPMLPHEDEVLRALYREFGITIDRYPQRPDDLTRLVDSWNSITGRSESAPDVLHYMISRRKKKKWEKLGRARQSQSVEAQVQLSPEDFAHLDAIHEELQIASDKFALNAELGLKLQHEFARRSGKIVPGMVLAAAMINRRKAGVLATLKPKTTEADLGFSDISEVTG